MKRSSCQLQRKLLKRRAVQDGGVHWLQSSQAMQEGPVVQHAAIIPSLTLSLQAKILNLTALALRRAK